MNNHRVSHNKLAFTFYARMLAFFFIWLAVYFLPAGTFAYWEAWVVLAILFIPMLFSFNFWLKKDPELLERRLKSGEKETEQQWIIKIFSVLFILTFLLPGFDRRFGWSAVPVVVVLAADVFVLLGYGLCFLTIYQNRYASRTVEVEQEQHITSSGLYAVVRHPMYLGVLVMCLALPLGLGSYWALIPALLVIPTLIARIFNEEAVLSRELPGYQEYMGKTRHRLIPGVW